MITHFSLLNDNMYYIFFFKLCLDYVYSSVLCVPVNYHVVLQ